MHSQKPRNEDGASPVVSLALKQSKPAKQDSETRAHDILQALPAAIYTTDAKGRITFSIRRPAILRAPSPASGSTNGA